MRTCEDSKRRITLFALRAPLKKRSRSAGAAVHNRGCSVPFPCCGGANSPQRPGEKISRGEPSNFAAVHLTITRHLGVSGPISLSSLSLSLCFPPVVYTAELQRFFFFFFSLSSPLLLFADSQFVARMRSARLG